MTKTRIFLERLVIVAIVASVAQIVLDDLSVLVGWSWYDRRIVLIAALALDVFFSVEFLSRLYGAFINRRTAAYFAREHGWVDLVASVPILLLVSGPVALAYWSGSLIATDLTRTVAVLTVVNAMRIVRTVRLLRVLKVFTRIRKPESAMRRRRLAVISTVSVGVVVTGALVSNMVFALAGLETVEGRYHQDLGDLVERVIRLDPQPSTGELELAALAQTEEPLLVVQRNGRTLYSRKTTDEYDRWFGPYDYGFSEHDGLRVFYDVRPLKQEQARTSMIASGLVVLLVVLLLIAYRRRFAVSATNPDGATLHE